MTSVNTSSRRTEGATLFVVVLMVLFLLAAVMAITAQLTIAGKRSSGDQEIALRAQYASESTLARARARTKVLSNALIYNSVSGQNTGVYIPSTLNETDLANLIKSLCAVTTISAPSPTTVVCKGTSSAPNVLAGVSATDLDTRLRLFSQYVDPYSLQAIGAPVDPTSQSSIQAYWRESFGGTANGSVLGTTVNGATTEGTFGMLLTKVMYTELNTYSIYLKIPNVNVKADSGSTSQALQAKSIGQEYVLVIAPESFAKYALFTNHHYSSDTDESTDKKIWFTDRIKYTGPVHTNQQFNFTGNNPGATFTGEVTSAGCKRSSLGGTKELTGCLAADLAPGANFSSTSTYFKSASQLGTSTSLNVTNSIGKNNVKATFGTVNWNSGFKKFPSGSTNQENDAKAGGLFIDGTTYPVSNMALSVATMGAASNGTIVGKSQVISYTQNSVTTTLYINESKQVYIAVGAPPVLKPAVQISTGAWVDKSALPTGQTAGASVFNGVVYVKAGLDANGKVQTGITSLRGPARTGGATSVTDTNPPTNPQPAIAKFMKMNIVSNGTMHIKSDLMYEDPPCNISGTACNNMAAKNILGLFSSDGDIAIDSPKKYGASQGVPVNVAIQAVTMATKGKVTVDGYDTAASVANELGNVNLLGGMIENYYGAFGLVSGEGFGRNIVYDKRTGKGFVPPSFPTLNEWHSKIFDSALTETGLDFGTASIVRVNAAQYSANKQASQ